MAVDSLLTGASHNQRLRIDFTWNGDRYQQTLWLMSGTRECCLLTSVEGTGQQAWPPSPPLQNLHQQKMPTGNSAALGVGMAGRSHWSLSVEASADQPTLTCDVACRVKEGPGDLAATWESGEDIAVHAIAERSVELAAALGGVRVFVDAQDEFAADLAVGNRIEHPGQQICLFPHSTAGTLPTTIRWRYRIELA